MTSDAIKAKIEELLQCAEESTTESVVLAYARMAEVYVQYLEARKLK